MAITQITDRDAMLEKQRLGFDATVLELDGSIIKVSIGSVVEYSSALYVVDTSAETPTGTATDEAYLYFDGTEFLWSTTAGSYDAELGAIYNGSDRRCRFRLNSATSWDTIILPGHDSQVIENDLTIGNDITVENDATFNGLVDIPDGSTWAGTYSSQEVDAETTWVIPEGAYVLTCEYDIADARPILQIYTGSAWVGAEDENIIFAGFLVTDGTNYRINNYDNGDSAIIHYRKIW